MKVEDFIDKLDESQKEWVREYVYSKEFDQKILNRVSELLIIFRKKLTLINQGENDERSVARNQQSE